MRDSIIQEVEETREELARRFDYDVRKIAAYLRERGRRRREQERQGNVSKEEASPQGSA